MGQADPVRDGARFLEYLDAWHGEVPAMPLARVIEPAGGAGGVAVYVVDMTRGFCSEGPLHSPRVQGIVPGIVDLMTRAHAAGVRNFVLPQDSHRPDALEFGEFPAHCVAGTREAETVPEIAGLPFAGEYAVIPKQSLSADHGTRLGRWLGEHPQVTRHVVVGDCTDLCVYQLAMHLKTLGNALQAPWEVIVPADCVQTYDLPVAAARQLGAAAHPAEFMHRVFLYHMALNGIRVVSRIS